MIKKLKNHFIPHKGNDDKPHMLRGKNIRDVVFIVLFLEIFTFLIPTITQINMTGGMASVLPAILADLTNSERKIQNLSTLTVNPVLNKAATMKAEDMASKGYFAHTSPEGKTPWYWLSEVGYKYQYAGENLAIDFSDSKDVTNAWMNSPTHKANIVKDKYTEVGTGIATGMYEGKETVFVAQVYANPLTSPLNTESKNAEEKEALPTIVNEVQNEPLVTDTTTDESQVEARNVLGSETVVSVDNSTQKSPTFWQKIFASPRNSSNILLYSIFILVSFSLSLYIFIKVRDHHYGLITNALIVLALILAILIGNYYISNRGMTITQSLDYSIENK